MVMVMMGSMVFSHIFLASCWTACMALTLLPYSSDEDVMMAATAPILAVQASQMVSADVGHTRRIVANAFALIRRVTTLPVDVPCPRSCPMAFLLPYRYGRAVRRCAPARGSARVVSPWDYPLHELHYNELQRTKQQLQLLEKICVRE